jgi:hypothetical protein
MTSREEGGDRAVRLIQDLGDLPEPEDSMAVLLTALSFLTVLTARDRQHAAEVAKGLGSSLIRSVVKDYDEVAAGLDKISALARHEGTRQ